MREEEKLKTDILFQIDMQLYDEFNDKLCEINEHLGEIYTYKDLQDIENAEKEKERILLREAIKELQKEIYRLQNIKRKDIQNLINNEKEKIYKNYISKDKIREAIKDRELEIYADNEEICNADGFCNIAFLYDKTIDILKGLLEEE